MRKASPNETLKIVDVGSRTQFFDLRLIENSSFLGLEPPASGSEIGI
jgi:hypothetical protein